MWRVVYETINRELVVVLVGAQTSESAARIARESDSEYTRVVQTIDETGKVWFISRTK